MTPRLPNVRIPILFGLLLSISCHAADELLVAPGAWDFDTPEFVDYEALYSSSSSATGAFTLHARRTGDGKTLTLVDMIPMQQFVVVAQRVIDLQTHRLGSFAGPYFAWGTEYVVSQSNPGTYEWVRVPIGGGEPVRVQGTMSHDGYVSDMFSPTLASLMPMETETVFRMPAPYPLVDGEVAVKLDRYKVLRKERLELASGHGCDCWVVEKRAGGDGPVDLIWVSREAPFVFRLHRDVGGTRDFVSDLLGYRALSR